MYVSMLLAVYSSIMYLMYVLTMETSFKLTLETLQVSNKLTLAWLFNIDAHPGATFVKVTLCNSWVFLMSALIMCVYDYDYHYIII